MQEYSEESLFVTVLGLPEADHQLAIYRTYYPFKDPVMEVNCKKDRISISLRKKSAFDSWYKLQHPNAATTNDDDDDDDDDSAKKDK